MYSKKDVKKRMKLRTIKAIITSYFSALFRKLRKQMKQQEIFYGTINNLRQVIMIIITKAVYIVLVFNI